MNLTLYIQDSGSHDKGIVDLISGSHDKGVVEGRPSQRGSAQRMFISRKQKSLNQLIVELELLSTDHPLLGFYSHHSFLPAWSLLPSFFQSLCSFHLSTLSWAFSFTLLPGLGWSLGELVDEIQRRKENVRTWTTSLYLAIRLPKTSSPPM